MSRDVTEEGQIFTNRVVMTPDELLELADKTYQRATFFRKDQRGAYGTFVQNDVIALCETARGHVALLRWAERAAESLRGISGDLEWVITEANQEHDGDYARLRLDESDALLAEFDQLRGAA